MNLTLLKTCLQCQTPFVAEGKAHRRSCCSSACRSVYHKKRRAGYMMEYSKLYYQGHRAKITADVKAYREENPEKVAASQAAKYQKNKDRLKARVEARRQRLMAPLKEYVDLAKVGPCTDCGHTFPPVAMDFDHVRGEKKYHISAMVNTLLRPLDEIVAEIAKCELVCACCHRVRTQLRLSEGAA